VPPLKKIKNAFLDYEIPADLQYTALLLVADIVLIYAPFLDVSSFKVLFSLPLLLFIPGFSLLAAQIPREGDVNLRGRILHAFGISLVIDGLTGIALSLSPWGLQLDSLIVVLFFFSAILILAAQYRRVMLRSAERYVVQFSEVSAPVKATLSPFGRNRVDRFVVVLLVLLLMGAVGITILIILFPQEQVRSTEFFLLGQNRTAGHYPDSMVAGQQYPLFIGVGNHEQGNVTYFIEIWDMAVSFDPAKNTTQILVMDPAGRFMESVADNETRITAYPLSVSGTDYNRVAFLLFNGPVPGPEVTGTDRINASYRNLYLRVSVQH
jgi:uncharacterized membrane protein